MFKSRRKMIRKCVESCQFTDRGIGKSRKNEGNSNITSKRLTIPPGFLCLGIKSKTIRKRADKEKRKTQRDYILREDLRGLFGDNLKETITKPRRSSRILKKVEEAQSIDGLSASDYYSKVLTQDNNNNNSRTSKEGEEDFHKNKVALRDNSKSLFRKINERCARAAIQNTLNFNYIIRPLVEDNAKVEEVFKVATFCKSLSKEVSTGTLRQTNALLDCQLAISKKIQVINDILCGKTTSEVDMSDDKNKKMEASTGHEDERKYFEYIPRCDWIYETPPRQRITLPKVDECAIQPAVICTTKKQSNIYELNPSINIDLTNYTNRQNVEFDRRYFKHLASFEDKMQVDYGIEYLESTGDQNPEDNNDSASYNYFANHEEQSVNFTFKNPFLNAPESQFMAVTSRPIKSVKKMPRINSILKRKLEELDSTPTCSHSKQIHDQLETDITFFDDNGQFKLSSQDKIDSNECSFSFKKNVFKDCEEENIFNFNRDEPKMFDFSQLQRNN